jgi:ubiquinol-cytochrome c reductase cytochrome b subunit
MRLIKQNFLLRYLYNEFINYPVYVNLSYLWNYGVLSFVCLSIQIITGIFLAMYYIASPEMAFLSVEHIMREINYGWLIRYLHANGASFFFLAVYIHFFRNLYYNSYIRPRELVWVIGILIMLIMILTAFLGYVLPWGQMSFWAATVITSLFSAIPIFGELIVIWLWGGYAVDSATLTRFFSLHYLFPFILIFLVILHVLFLHEQGSTNPLGLVLKTDKIFFSPYYIWKDFFSIIIFIFFFLIFVFFYPNYLGHTDNYIPANSLVTPAHIVPEWYFLPFYAILRSIPNKLGGILVLFSAIIILFILPFIVLNKLRNKNFFFWQKFFFWLFVMNCLLLGWLGGQSVEYPYLNFGQILTINYFLYFFVILNSLFIYNYFIIKLKSLNIQDFKKWA